MKNLLKTVLALTALVCVGSAYAVGTLTLFDGTTTITVTDGSALDANPAPGAVTFIGSIGIWTLNVDTGLTKPAVGSATSPQMDLAFLAVSSSRTGGTLTITWSDSGFSASGTGTDSFGGTTQGSVFDEIQVNGFTALTLGPFTTKFGAITSGFFVLGPSDTLSLVVDVTHGAGLGLVSSGDKNFNMVPDGGSAVALLGIALAGIEGLRRMMRARKA